MKLISNTVFSFVAPLLIMSLLIVGTFVTTQTAHAQSNQSSSQTEMIAQIQYLIGIIEGLMKKQQLLESMTNQSNSIVTLETNYGDITLELFTDVMPITTANFGKLVQEDYYDGVLFHRVIDGFMIQSGDPNTKTDDVNSYGTGGPGYVIKDEFVADPRVTNLRGTLSMANAGPNSGGSQFFINLVDNQNLDFDKQPLVSKHPVFGQVIAGMDVVDLIGAVEVGDTDRPVQPVVIQDALIEIRK